MTSVLYCKSKSFTVLLSITPVIRVPSGDQFYSNQFGPVVPSSKSEIQWIRGGIPSRNYLRILAQDHPHYCLHCFPQGMQRMKIVIGSSAERVCNS